VPGRNTGDPPFASVELRLLMTSGMDSGCDGGEDDMPKVFGYCSSVSKKKPLTDRRDSSKRRTGENVPGRSRRLGLLASLACSVRAWCC